MADLIDAAVVDPGEPTDAEAPAASRRRRWRIPSVGLVMATVWMGLILAAAAVGPWLPLQDPADQSPCTTKQPRVVREGSQTVLKEQPGCPSQVAADDKSEAKPSPRHPLGTDKIGRDVLSRAVAGARTTVEIAFGAVLTAVAIGGIIGALVAYAGGWVDRVLTSLLTGLLAMPAIVTAIALVAALGASKFAVWLALTVVATPAVAMLSRGQALSLVRREYVTASKALGARHRRVIALEVLPNLLPFAFVFVGIGVAAAIAAEGGLAVLGLGVPEPAISWGAMISDGRDKLQTAPHIALIPSAVMFLTIWATTYLTDQARTHFDIRESQL